MQYPQLNQTEASDFFYMTNMDVRDYQFEISKSLVTKNTLVVIPTGLGKTFIAAVIIFNFYRWFPTGKILFLAPLKPLVHQQMRSIKEFLQINSKEIYELTGSTDPKIRASIWEKGHVFFATPQTVANDLDNSICPASKVVLVIVDEAHHASGDYAYCKVVSGIAEYTKFFRVVGLTATPGNDFDKVQQIIYNLMIANIEYRTDNDYAQYVKTRDIVPEVIPETPAVVELTARLNSVIKKFLTVLHANNLVPHTDPTRTTKGQIAMLMKNRVIGECSQTVTSTVSLLTMREYLQNYSVRVFVEELNEQITRPDRSDKELKECLAPLLSTAKALPQDDPKLDKLCEIVTNFVASNPESRVIIFCNFRKIVNIIKTALKEASSDIHVAEFIGQATSADSKGLNQAQQLKVLEAFRRGSINTLVATAIGEEGLDIGEVDLIICYDNQKSMTRTIQRIGRTGRKRDGKVIFMINESQRAMISDTEKATSKVSGMLRRRMNDFEFYKGNEIMNPNKLRMIKKKMEIIEDPNAKNASKPSNNRKMLLTDESAELKVSFGEEFNYKSLSLSKDIYSNTYINTYQISASAESNIFVSLLQEYIMTDNVEVEKVFCTTDTSTDGLPTDISSTPPNPPSSLRVSQLRALAMENNSDHESANELEDSQDKQPVPKPPSLTFDSLIFNFKESTAESTSESSQLFMNTQLLQDAQPRSLATQESGSPSGFYKPKQSTPSNESIPLKNSETPEKIESYVNEAPIVKKLTPNYVDDVINIGSSDSSDVIPADVEDGMKLPTNINMYEDSNSDDDQIPSVRPDQEDRDELLRRIAANATRGVDLIEDGVSESEPFFSESDVELFPLEPLSQPQKRVTQSLKQTFSESSSSSASDADSIDDFIVPDRVEKESQRDVAASSINVGALLGIKTQMSQGKKKFGFKFGDSDFDSD